MSVTVSEHQRLVGKVNEMKSRWGSGGDVPGHATGQAFSAWNINTIINTINEGKRVSGWTGGVNGHVGTGSVITNVLNALYNQAEAIRAHCPCNCNHCACNCNHCSCNCNHCSCNCDNCCDDGGDSAC